MFTLTGLTLTQERTVVTLTRHIRIRYASSQFDESSVIMAEESETAVCKFYARGISDPVIRSFSVLMNKAASKIYCLVGMSL